MSELSEQRLPRQRRSDAERSIAAILDAAARVLSARPDASIGEIAEAAGVTRQTVYAHFSSRSRLVNAVIDRVTLQVVTAIDAAQLDEGPPTAALVRFLTTSWRTMERYPLLLHVPPAHEDDQAEREQLTPILARLERLVTRGKREGAFDGRLSTSWLVTATISLAHAAGEEVAVGRMTFDEGIDALQHSVLRLFGATTDDA
jgi:AcrR family transcriptional regulator